jgi:hypothetical protein
MEGGVTAGYRYGDLAEVRVPNYAEQSARHEETYG